MEDMIAKKLIRALSFLVLTGACTPSHEHEHDHEHDHEHEHTSGGGAQGEGGSQGENTDICCTLGAICHIIDDDADPKIKTCHDIGHENDQAACSLAFEECQALCSKLNDDPVEHSCN